MCGINGIIYKKEISNIAEIAQMNLAINHRGPDDSGVLKFENILLGHVRLSIQDLSSKGKQPMSNDGKFWIIYNGEIYNFKEIKNELSKKGYKFFSNTDTEVILNAFKEWGYQSFSKFNGMWCFAILNKEKKELIVCRDRYGVKPCYYYTSDNKIIFSSEIKGIYSSNENINFDKNKIVYEPRTLEGSFTTYFKNIEIVPPGSFLKINLQNLEIKKTRWWKGLQNFPNISANYKKNKETLMELLFDSIKLRLVSDVKISTSLSGGIDSSIVFAILNKLNVDQKVSLNPFIFKDDNISFNQALDLVKFYKKEPIIVQNVETKNNEFSEKLAAIEIPETYFNQLEIYKIQNKNNFKISIDGHGADECLGGYIKDLQLFPMQYQNSLIGIYQSLENLENESALQNIIKKYKFVDTLKGYNTNIQSLFYSDNIFKNKINLYKNYIDAKMIDLQSEHFLEDLDDLKNFSFATQLLYYHANYGHMQWLLNKWDKASMSSSVEIRSPYLDWNFFQFALILPPEYKINHGKNKLILRDTFHDILPNSINQDIKKQGLKSKNYKLNNLNLKIMEEILNQKSFNENNYWDGKKILEDFNNNKNQNKIWKIFCLYSLKEGFENRKIKCLSINKSEKESFNFLN